MNAKMKCMVTGGTGLIGNKLIEKLCSEGCVIHALCRSTSDTSSLTHPNIKIFIGDILDKTSIEKAMFGCEAVYHLAAYARNWAKDPNIYYEYNTQSLINILDISLKYNLKRVLFTSSSIVLGNSNGKPNDETNLRSIPPLTVYEDSKLKAEKVIEQYLNLGMDIIRVYPTRPFGPGLLVESNALCYIIDLYLKGKWRVILGDGNATGNYVFLDDVVSGMTNAMKLGRKGERYILGGDNLSLNKFFSLLKEISGRKYRMFHIPEKVALIISKIEEYRARVSNHYPLITPGWVKTFCLDWSFSSDKAIKEIDYKITPFEDALNKTVMWLASKETGNQL